MAETPFTNPNVPNRHTDVTVPGAGAADGTLIGLTSSDLVGFYGAQPIAQGSWSQGSGTLVQLATLLGNMGLINLTA
jgi:hypothetical protein